MKRFMLTVALTFLMLIAFGMDAQAQQAAGGV
jgi:hypothetical protein